MRGVCLKRGRVPWLFLCRLFERKSERSTGSCFRWSQESSFLRPSPLRFSPSICELHKMLASSTGCVSSVHAFCGNQLSVVPRSRCSNSSKSVLKETPSKNSKLFEAHSVAPASSATSVLGAQEQPSHKPPLYSTPSYPCNIFESHNSTAQHQQENLPASNTQSEGKNQKQTSSQMYGAKALDSLLFCSWTSAQLGNSVVIIRITMFLNFILCRIRLGHFAQSKGFQNPSSKVRGCKWHPEQTRAGGNSHSLFWFH